MAWGVDVKVPLVISLSFSFYYLDSSAAPKLELFQVKGTVKDKVFKLRSQLTCTPLSVRCICLACPTRPLCVCTVSCVCISRVWMRVKRGSLSALSAIVSTFVSREWPLWSGKKRPAVQTFASKDAPKEPKAAPAPADAKGAAAAANKPGFLGKLLGSKEKREVETVMDGAFKKPVSSPPPKAGANAGGHRDAEIAQLCEMGFTIEVRRLLPARCLAPHTCLARRTPRGIRHARQPLAAAQTVTMVFSSHLYLGGHSGAQYDEEL